jgi:hypothetical protein
MGESYDIGKLTKKAKKPSRLSPEARARIAEAQRNRWVATKKAAKKNG